MLAKSHLFSEMLNSIGGIVYTRNRYAQIVGRARVHPIDFNSTILERTRAIFSQAVKGYQALTDGQRLAWDQYASQTPWKNALGDTVYLTGQAMYIATRCASVTYDPTIPAADFNTAPAVPGLKAQPTLSFSFCTAPDTGVLVTVANNDSEAMDFVVYASDTKSASKHWYQGPFRRELITALSNVPADGSDTTSCFAAAAGNRIFFMVRGYATAAPHTICQPVYGNALAGQTV